MKGDTMEIKSWSANAHCPYCKFTNVINHKWDIPESARWGRPFILECDSEEGGCGRYFAAKIKLEVVTETRPVDL